MTFMSTTQLRTGHMTVGTARCLFLLFRISHWVVLPCCNFLEVDSLDMSMGIVVQVSFNFQLHFRRIQGDFLFKLGVFLVLLGAGLTGWGCSCPCGGAKDYGTAVGPCAETLVPEGSCYARVAYVPMACRSVQPLIKEFYVAK